MYRIIKIDGTTLGTTDSINYIRVAKNGCLVLCRQEEAIGVAFESVAYNLPGHGEIPGAETVTVQEFDGGKAIAEMESEIKRLENELLAANKDQAAALDAIYTGVTE